MATLTGASTVIMLSVTNLFTTPQQLQGFAADDVFDTEQLASAETLMGVDGLLSGGWVAVPVKQNYTLQADSPSIALFDQWWATQQQIRDVLPASGVCIIPALGKKWNMTKGFLVGYTPLPTVKKLSQPQKFAIQWQSLIPNPTGA